MDQNSLRLGEQLIYLSVVVTFAVGLMLQLAAPDLLESFYLAERRRHGQALEQALADLEARLSTETMHWLKPVRHLPKGSPREELPALAARLDADILVLGTLGRGGVPGLLSGNTAEAVLQRLDRAVLAVKPEGFVSPVAV